MYNKYFTMKRSELKEAIKAEITSVLSEEMSPEEVKQKMDQARRGGAKSKPLAKLATIGLEGKTVKIKGNQQEYKVEKVMANGDVLISRDGGEKTLTKRPMELELAEGDLNEGKRGVVVDPDEIKFHLDQFYGGNIDGNDLANAIEEILSDMMKRSVTFSDIREAKSAADVNQELKAKKAEMVEKAQEYKKAEGEKKEKIKDQLKKMTAEKNELEKKVNDLKKKEEEKIANKGRDQELDA